MTNQELTNKLSQYPLDLPVVFFCNEDVVGQEFIWNECYIEEIKECLYIEYDGKIFKSIDDFKEYLEYHTDWDYELIDKIIKTQAKPKVLRIDLNVT